MDSTEPANAANGTSPTGDTPQVHGGDVEGAAALPDLEPLTFGTLGRFFAVPLVIISTIVGGAVLVVLLFGGPAAPSKRSVDALLQALESTSGERSMGILLPREKELWQTALELSVRLENKDKDGELSEADLTSVSDRLGTMVRADLENLHRISSIGDDRAIQRDVRSKRLEFMIRALGRTERPDAIGTLVDIVRAGESPYALVAMQMLADLREHDQAREAVGPMMTLLASANQNETRLVACTALSVLAARGNPAVIDALTSARLTGDGEVGWSASLALARLGSNSGKPTLFDLLDRSFLESGKLYHVRDESGTLHRYQLPPERVEGLMVAAIDAASNLGDADLWETIEGLQSDGSPVVRARASEVKRPQ